MEITLKPAYTVSRQACFLLEKFSPSAGAQFRFYDDSIRFAEPSCMYNVEYKFHVNK
jgi:hypothetical protein